MKSLLRTVTLCGMLLSIVVVPTSAQAPAPPTGLNQQVNGPVVTASWNAVGGAVAYVVQVGTASGASNLFNGSVGNITSASGSLPVGTYFWRVIAVGPSGALSSPSAESQFTIGSVGPCVPPGPPQSFTSSVADVVVSLSWAAPLIGTPPFTYIIEAGSGSGQANLAVLPTGSSATQFATAAPAGTYFVRLRAQNACGVSDVSTEEVVSVGNVGAPCTYAVSPTQINAPATGGAIQINVAAPGGCRWQLMSDPFIVPTSTTSGSGPAPIAYNVLPTSVSRSGVVTIGGIDPGPVIAPQVLVQQTVGAPTGCVVTLTPTSQMVGSDGGEFDLTVNANPGCMWTGTPTMGFITVLSPGSRNGTGTIRYRVDPNPGQSTRTGALRVATAGGFQDLAISQLGSSPLTARFEFTQANLRPCQFRFDDKGNGLQPIAECVLDASASGPADQIASYQWQTTYSGGLKSVFGLKVELRWDCTNCQSGQENFEVTLTVHGKGGQTATEKRNFTVFRTGPVR